MILHAEHAGCFLQYQLDIPLVAPPSVFTTVNDSEDEDELAPMPTDLGFIARVPSLNAWMSMLGQTRVDEGATVKPMVPVKGVISFGDLVALQQVQHGWLALHGC